MGLYTGSLRTGKKGEREGVCIWSPGRPCDVRRPLIKKKEERLKSER
jgi:hypothetical protein